MMHIRVQRGDFLSILAQVQGVVETKKTLPILSHLLLEAGEAGLSVFGTDLDVGIRSGIPAEILTPGAIALSAKKLYEIIRELPEAPVELRMQEELNAEITCQRSRFKVKGLPKDEFPARPEIAGEGGLRRLRREGRLRDPDEAVQLVSAVRRPDDEAFRKAFHQGLRLSRYPARDRGARADNQPQPLGRALRGGFGGKRDRFPPQLQRTVERHLLDVGRRVGPGVDHPVVPLTLGDDPRPVVGVDLVDLLARAGDDAVLLGRDAHVVDADRVIERAIAWLREKHPAAEALVETRAALRRIEEGTYGFCEETGEPISLKRLEARPIWPCSTATSACGRPGWAASWCFRNNDRSRTRLLGHGFTAPRRNRSRARACRAPRGSPT